MSLRAITYVDENGAPVAVQAVAQVGVEARNTLIAVLGATVLSAGIGAVMGGSKAALTGGLLVGGLVAAVGGASVGYRAQNVSAQYAEAADITLTAAQGDPAKQRLIGYGTAGVGAVALAWGAYRWSKR